MPESLDDEFVSELFKTYSKMMFKTALDILRNKPDAEDAVQEAFLRVMSTLETVSQIPEKEMTFYFASVIKNVSINHLNKEKQHSSEDIDEQYDLALDYSVEIKADENFLLDEVKLALKALSDRDYSIIYLCYFVQMTPKEIAGELDISEKNIHKYIERAKKRFMKILKERGIGYDL